MQKRADGEMSTVPSAPIGVCSPPRPRTDSPSGLAIAFAFALCVVGIVGDLVESLLKRDAEVKDTGALLPGMGGMLDRIDAHLLGLPTLYYLMLGYPYVEAS